MFEMTKRENKNESQLYGVKLIQNPIVVSDCWTGWTLIFLNFKTDGIRVHVFYVSNIQISYLWYFYNRYL